MDAHGLVEVHVAAVPDPSATTFEAQTASMYEALRTALVDGGLSERDVIAERVFTRMVPGFTSRLEAVRRRFYPVLPATTAVVQPPAHPRRMCEMQAVALSARAGRPEWRSISASPPVTGRLFAIGEARILRLAGLCGAPRPRPDIETEAEAMLLRAEAALLGEGMTFRDVARTWIYLSDIDRDYAAFNSARRRFFRSRGMLRFPASTGIGAAACPPGGACVMDLLAVAGGGAAAGPRRPAPEPLLSALRSPTMNEAADYGSDFSRALRVDTDPPLIHVSGTASIDRLGRTAHAGDFRRQAEATLDNIEALLGEEGTDFGALVSAIVYLKRPRDLETFESIARRRLPRGIPRTVCVADVCRREWLVEIEVVARSGVGRAVTVGGDRRDRAAVRGGRGEAG